MNQFVKIEFFDENGKLLAQFVKQPEERLVIPVQSVPSAVSYKMSDPDFGERTGSLIPVYMF